MLRSYKSTGSKRYYSRLPLRSRLPFIILLLVACFAQLRHALLRCVMVSAEQKHTPPGRAPFYAFPPMAHPFCTSRGKPKTGFWEWEKLHDLRNF